MFAESALQSGWLVVQALSHVDTRSKVAAESVRFSCNLFCISDKTSGRISE
jgi:hypothetical protein